MASKSSARVGAQASTDAAFVRNLEKAAMDKILEKLEGPLQGIVHDALSEAIVHAMHAEPRSFAADRETSIRLPKEGGLCAAVWIELDKVHAKKGTPTLKEALKIGARKKWNPNNTRVEYYAWRKHKGISGRLPSTPAANEVHVTH